MTRARRNAWMLLAAAAGGATALMASGCQSSVQAADAHNAGQFAQAKAIVTDPKNDGAKNDNNDRLLWLIEEGKIVQDAGDPGGSMSAFATASDWCERFAIYEPKTTIQEEAASMVLNQKMRVFRGTYSDRIMVDSYAVLDALWLGDPGKAGVYANRVNERQTDAEVEQQKQIDKVQGEINGYQQGDAKALVEQVKRSSQMQGIYTDESYAAYLNPFASWISGIAWSASDGGGNMEKAAVAFKKALSMMPQNGVLSQAVQSNPFRAASSNPQVLVLFEGGRGPSLKDLTIPLITPWAGFSSIPIPVPDFHPTDVQSLSINLGGSAINTQLLADNDAIFKAQYDRMLPEIVFRTAVMIAAKEAGTVAAVQATRNNSGAQIGTLAVMSVYKAVTNQADTRSWRTIGKFMQVAQVDRPASGSLAVAVVGSGGGLGPASPVTLPEGRVVMLYVRSVSAGATAVYPFVLAK